MAAQPARRRLDAELVRRGLATSRRHAQELVAAGRVTVGGAPALKVARQVRADEPLLVAGDGPRYVSRAGGKLAAALGRFGVDPAGRRVLDVGASTGGFTDCVLQRGAVGVVAVDVGYGQLHEKLRDDPRVTVRDRTNVRELGPGDLGESFSLVVADLSFISLRLVLPVLVGLATSPADLVVLVKPQFEAGRREVARGRGVIRSAEVWRQAVDGVGAAVHDAGAVMMDVMVSPVRGAEGNVEFLLHAVAGDRPDGAGDGPARDGVAARVASAVDEAVALAAREGS